MERLWPKGIYGRLFRSFFVISLVPLICLGAFTLAFTRQLSLNSVESELEATALYAAGIMDSELAKYRESLTLFSEYDEVKNLFKNRALTEGEVVQLNQKMYLIMDGRADQLEVRVISTDGEVIHSTGGDEGVPDDIYSYWGILRALSSAEGVILYPGTYGNSNGGLTLACPVIEEGRGERPGYALLCFPESAINEILISHVTELPVRCALVDSNNYLLANQLTEQDAVFLPLEYRELLRGLEQGESVTFERDGDQMMLARERLKDNGLELLTSVSVGLVISSNSEYKAWMMLIGAAALLLSLYVSKRVAKRIVQPIQVICATMESVEQGDLDAVVPEQGDVEFRAMARGFNHMLVELKEQFQANMERQNRLRLAEFKNLQAQISPHFLYNTLESIKYMARLGMNSEIDTVASKLGIMLKSGMNFKQDMIPFRDELKVVKSYIAIQQIRYEGKFTYSQEIEKGLLECMVPNLVIQPLVENAVVHGLEPKMGSGVLTLTAKSYGSDMYVEIYDNGEGIERERLAGILSGEMDSGEVSDSIGMVNVSRRLKLYFGEDYGLSVESSPGRFTKVTVRMPKEEGGLRDVQGSDS